MRREGRNLKFFLLSIIGLVFFAAVSDGYARESGALNGSRKSKEEKVTRAKAHYYFMAGVRSQVENRHEEAYENYRHAFQIDPSYEAAAYLYGQHRLVSNVDTLQSSAELSNSLSMMRQFVENYPGNYEEGAYYAFAAGRLDTIQEAIRVYERLDSLFPDRTNLLLLLSDAYFSNFEDEKGMAALDRYEKAEGKSYNLTLRKISYFVNRKDTAGAIKETAALIESNPREPMFWMLRGSVMQLLGQTDSVEPYFLKAEEIAPGNGTAKLALADLYLERGDSAAYDNKIYEALLAEDFEVEDKTSLLAEYLQKLISAKNDTKRGDYLFSVLEGQYPFDPSVCDLAARYSAAKGNYDKAIEKIDYALNMDLANETYWGQKMTYLISSDRWKDAIATYEQAITHVQPTQGLRALCASAAQIGEDYPLAIRMYGEMIHDIAPKLTITGEIDMKDFPEGINLQGLEQISALYTTIGDCLYNSKQTDRAFEAYENALKIDPENAMALNNYAYFMVENGGDMDKAAELSEKSLRGTNADNPTFLDTFAWILFKQGKLEEAIATQKKALESLGDDKNGSEDFWSHYGDMLNASGDRQGAVEAWEKALEQADDKTDLIRKINENK